MLVHPCRIHLFSTVVIKDNAHRFVDLLKQEPTIANYLRELTYHTRVLSEDLANAFIQLNNIESLVLLANDSSSDVHEWELFTPHMQHALIHLFISPSITYIHIDLLEGLPAILLSSCSNLKHLKVTYCCRFSSQACNTILGVPPKLLSLHVNHATDHRETFNATIHRSDGLPILDLSSLKSLAIGIRTIEDEIVLENILRLIHTLETLQCRVLASSISNNLAQRLTTLLPTLRVLHLQWMTPFAVRDCLPLTILLEALACQPNCINELQLFIGNHPNSPLVDVDQVGAQLDQILRDRPGFRQLRKLKIHIWYPYLCKDSRKHIRLEFKDIDTTTKLSQILLLANDHDEFTLSVDK